MGFIAPLFGAFASLAGSFLSRPSAPALPPPPPPGAGTTDKDMVERAASEAAKLRAAKRRGAGGSTTGGLTEEDPTIKRAEENADNEDATLVRPQVSSEDETIVRDTDETTMGDAPDMEILKFGGKRWDHGQRGTIQRDRNMFRTIV